VSETWRKRIVEVCAVGLIVAGVAIGLWKGLFYWAANPSLTKMQLWLANWDWFVLSAVMLVLGFVVLDKVGKRSVEPQDSMKWLAGLLYDSEEERP
jgi:hypothetical protein